MRHLKKAKKFHREKGARKALFATTANNFFMHGKIKLTEPKAKTLKPIVEKMITRAKKGALSDIRILAKTLAPKNIKKIKEIAAKYSSRSGGYTRITKLGARKSDAARMATLELV